MDKQGLILCSKYAISPNALGYCGPKETVSLVDHLKENIVDKEVNHILSEFETMYPYLQLIARENKIKDPYNHRVVEAYWLGNSLLKNISSSDYLSFLQEKLLIEKKIVKKDFQKIKEKIAKYIFLPHHTFHVFNIFKKMSKDITLQTLTAMDECRIGYGVITKKLKVKDQSYNSKIKNNTILIVNCKPLRFNKYLQLGAVIKREIKVDFYNEQFIEELKPGNWLSFHWGQVCDKLTIDQVKNLNYYTQQAINFFNQK